MASNAPANSFKTIPLAQQCRWSPTLPIFPANREFCREFCKIAGVAGNFVLTFRACGGSYIVGGIAPRIANFLAQSEFRARFEAKGRFRSYLERIPTSVIMHPDATFPGLKALTETMENDAC